MNDLQSIFDQLRTLLQAYAPPLVARRDEPGYYDLWSVKPVVIEVRKRKEVFFAGAIVQKGYVGLYYMPVYAEEELKAVFDPRLRALLKGKSCFHVKKLDAELLGQVEAALKIGFDLYRERGWV